MSVERQFEEIINENIFGNRLKLFTCGRMYKVRDTPLTVYDVLMMENPTIEDVLSINNLTEEDEELIEDWQRGDISLNVALRECLKREMRIDAVNKKAVEEFNKEMMDRKKDVVEVLCQNKSMISAIEDRMKYELMMVDMILSRMA